MGTFVTPVALPRRLTQLFNDNKKTYEELVQTRSDSPDLAPLQLKLRIQKDRLLAWGIQWSDRSKAGDIDGSLHRAGISDLVASILDSIKRLLTDAERLQPFTFITPDTSLDRARGKLPLPASPVNVGQRLEEITRDLTTSIDTLCDLSRQRLEPPNLEKGESSLSEKSRFDSHYSYSDQSALADRDDLPSKQNVVVSDTSPSASGLTDLMRHHPLTKQLQQVQRIGSWLD